MAEEGALTVAETTPVSGQSLQIVEHYAKKRSGRKLSTAAIHKLEGQSMNRKTDWKTHSFTEETRLTRR